ncbi:hypothetical protein [Cohnella rhizosphaerae]|uniref:Uncharacterized protein n=1 Tax=Cohnella rhizosphaerae TaxID=1457232 RepID=A0A9X4KV53_9BACL|nr:hypothetical protein [Cohnella rhizosphaerae]MDG0811665.1 hypothetical protein [Cohnella rhizosphaerae]
MTMPEQPSGLSKEELAGLLGAVRKQSDRARDRNDPEPETAPDAPSSPQTTTSSPTAAASEGARAEEGRPDDLQMVLGHWERTVASLQRELIELRSRVARLEQQLGEQPARQTPPSSPAVAGRAGEGEKPKAGASHPEDAPATLSRVRTYRSKRGWF